MTGRHHANKAAAAVQPKQGMLWPLHVVLPVACGGSRHGNSPGALSSSTHKAAAVDVQCRPEVPDLPLLQVCEPAEQLQEQCWLQALGAAAGVHQSQDRQLAEGGAVGVPVLQE